jgi:serine protease inhibitor
VNTNQFLVYADNMDCFNILQATSVEAGKFMNVAISPFSVWTVLTLLREGSAGKTNSQLQRALHLLENNKAIRAAFRKLNNAVHVSTLICYVAWSPSIFL